MCELDKERFEPVGRFMIDEASQISPMFSLDEKINISSILGIFK